MSLATEMQWGKLNAYYVATAAANALATVAEEVRAGNRTMLRSASTGLARLGPSGDLGLDLSAGRITEERWLAIATTYAEGLASVMESLGEENTLSRFWGEVVIPTARDTGTAIKDAASGFGFGLGAVAGLLALVVAWKVFR